MLGEAHGLRRAIGILPQEGVVKEVEKSSSEHRCQM